MARQSGMKEEALKRPQKILKKSKAIKKEPPASLTMRLYDPGMSIMHRAGLGGLACTLRYIEQAYKKGTFLDDEVPGGPWVDGQPPWTISPLEVTIDFGQPNLAREYLKRLFALSFQIREGMMFFPAQHLVIPKNEVLAELQSGMLLSFLQHGRVRNLSKEETLLSYEVDGQMLSLRVKKCSSYRHQKGWEDLCDINGIKVAKVIPVEGPLFPGAVVRHVAFNSQTRIQESVERGLALNFAPIGCLTLSINRREGVLLVPDVSDLLVFAQIRPFMTPQTTRDCRITSSGDAALQVQIRLNSARIINLSKIPGCNAITFQSMPWASQQKSRMHTFYVSTSDVNRLKQFSVALAELPPRIVSTKKKNASEKSNKKEQNEVTEYFWAESILRPLVAI